MKSLMPALGCIVLVAVADPGAACAQERYPSRPVQVIVPATAGGPVDTAVRIIEPGLSAALGEPVILQNRPGASGTVGMQDVATAEPNGYTIGQGVNSIFTITRISGTNVPFTLDNFTLLGNYATDVSILAIHPDAPWKTLDELIAYVRDNPGKLTYSSAGVGTVSSLSMQAIRHRFKLDMMAVPFQGGAQLTVAILGDTSTSEWCRTPLERRCSARGSFALSLPRHRIGCVITRCSDLGRKGHHRQRAKSNHGSLCAAWAA